MRVMDVILSFPPLVLALALAAAMGPSLNNAILAVAFVMIPKFARLVSGRSPFGQGETIHHGRPRLGGEESVDRPASYPPQLRLVRHRPVYADPGRDHPDRGLAELHRAGRATAHARMGRHGQRRPQVSDGSVVVRHVSRPLHSGDGHRVQHLWGCAARHPRPENPQVAMAEPLLGIRNLSVQFFTYQGWCERSKD